MHNLRFWRCTYLFCWRNLNDRLLAIAKWYQQSNWNWSEVFLVWIQVYSQYVLWISLEIAKNWMKDMMCYVILQSSVLLNWGQCWMKTTKCLWDYSAYKRNLYGGCIENTRKTSEVKRKRQLWIIMKVDKGNKKC